LQPVLQGRSLSKLDSELLSNYYCGCQLHYQELDCVDGQFDEDREQDRGENFLDDWRDIYAIL
jgi:hypothetical protein